MMIDKDLYGEEEKTMELLYSDNTLNITLDERLDSDNAPECERCIFEYLEKTKDVQKTQTLAAISWEKIGVWNRKTFTAITRDLAEW